MKTTDKPIFQEFSIDGIKHISPTDAMEAVSKNDAVLIDVREPNELVLESIPLNNVLNHPLSVILDRLPYIGKNQNIVLACTNGFRSAKIANLLNLEGYPNVANLDGGLDQWKKQGLPYEQKSSSNEPTNAGGCGCGCDCGATSSNNDKGSCC